MQKMKQDILDTHDHIKFGFYSGFTDPESHLPCSKNSYSYGCSTMVPYEGFTKVWIAVEILQPLLRDDLTASER